MPASRRRRRMGGRGRIEKGEKWRILSRGEGGRRRIWGLCA